jgi:hypothetical protein
MNKQLAKLKQHPKYDKSTQHWAKLISITGSAQIILQALGFVCGILVDGLPTQVCSLYPCQHQY